MTSTSLSSMKFGAPPTRGINVSTRHSKNALGEAQFTFSSASTRGDCGIRTILFGVLTFTYSGHFCGMAEMLTPVR